jgi:ERCC4-type nuclease
MSEITILRDTREQKPWEFDDLDADCRDVTLTTCDYTLEEFCFHDSELDTYIPTYGIERKSGNDFVGSITHTRDNFEEEIARASSWDSPLLVLVEEPRDPNRYQEDIFEWYDISRETALNTVESWERYKNVRFQFTGNRKRAQQIAYSSLRTQLRASK